MNLRTMISNICSKKSRAMLFNSHHQNESANGWQISMLPSCFVGTPTFRVP